MRVNSGPVARWSRRAVRAARSMRPVQYRAVVRFSIFDPKWTQWQATKSVFASPEEYRDHLWSHERLEPRLRVFGQYAAPIYQRMAEGHDFRVVVLHSGDLTEPWLGELRALAGRYPVLRLAPVAGMVDVRDVVREDLEDGGHTGPVVMLRVDDDDVLAADFLTQLAPYAAANHNQWCISLSRGVAARLTAGGLTSFRRYEAPFSSIGQAFVGSYRARDRRVFLPPMTAHTRIASRRPTIVDARKVAFLQVRHAFQDTRLAHGAERAERMLEKQLSRMAPVTDYAMLRTKFPTLSPVLTEDGVQVDASGAGG